MLMHMTRRLHARAIVTGGILVCTSIMVTGCGGSKSEPISSANSEYQVDKDQATDSTSDSSSSNASSGKSTTATKTTNGQQSTIASAPSSGGVTPPIDPSPKPVASKLSDLKVPEGGKEQLLEFLGKIDKHFEDLRTGRIQHTNVESLQKEAAEALRLKLQASDKLLAIEGLDKESRAQAIESKLVSLSMLSQLGDEGIDLAMTEFANELLKDPDYSVRGSLILFGQNVDRLAAGQLEDPKILLNDLGKILQGKDLSRPEYETLRHAAIMMLNAGELNAGKQSLSMIRDAFANNPDQELAADAKALDQELALVEYKEAWQNVAYEENGDLDRLAATAAKIIETGPDMEVFSELSSDAMNMEYSGEIDGAKVLYDLIRANYANSSTEAIAKRATDTLASADKRLGLIGKPFPITGVTMSGETFDWSKYSGKVVLVDFWATWCGPCRAEFPNLKENYAKYRDKGFEIIGVNLDDEHQQADEYLKQQPLPWTTVRSPNADEAGFGNPNAARAGVEAIPFLVLVGQDGNVVALHTRGQQLGKKLEELLGPADAKPAPTDNSDSRRPSSVRFVAFLANEEDTASSDEEPDEPSNPYLAPANLSDADLANFLLDMDEKPKSIQYRDGFAAAIVDAADRLLAMETQDKYQIIAIEAKLAILHRDASLGDDAADAALRSFVDSLKDDSRDRVARQIQFFQMECKMVDVDQLDAEQIPGLLAELKDYLKDQKLTGKHLRLASSTVHAINQLSDANVRETYFKEFGSLFGASSDKQLASYGKKLAKPIEGATEDQLVGKPLELNGITALGQPFDWTAYRGKVVLVDFWATWCGPCRREMPHVREMYDRLKERGFEVVGVNLDQDEEALAKFLEDNDAPWVNLVGEPSQQLAKKYGIRGIPTMILVDKEGKVAAMSHQVASLTAKVESLVSGEKANTDS